MVVVKLETKVCIEVYTGAERCKEVQKLSGKRGYDM